MRAAILAMVLGMVPVAFAADGPTIGETPGAQTKPAAPAPVKIIVQLERRQGRTIAQAFGEETELGTPESKEKLTALLAKRRRETVGEAILVIRADKNITWEPVAGLMEASKNAKFDQMTVEQVMPEAASAPAGNSAEAVRDTLFSTTARGTVALPPSAATSSQPANAGTLPPVGPKEPKVKTVMEGTLIFKQVGRLSRDEKSGQYIFSFDADGKAMRDPPMIVVPSKALAAMEKQSESGSKPVRFQVTGEVTEYNGKNHLLVHAVLVLRDINTGISGH